MPDSPTYTITITAHRTDGDSSQIPTDLFALGVLLAQPIIDHNVELLAMGLTVDKMVGDVGTPEYVFNEPS